MGRERIRKFKEELHLRLKEEGFQITPSSIQFKSKSDKQAAIDKLVQVVNQISLDTNVLNRSQLIIKDLKIDNMVVVGAWSYNLDTKTLWLSKEAKEILEIQSKKQIDREVFLRTFLVDSLSSLQNKIIKACELKGVYAENIQVSLKGIEKNLYIKAKFHPDEETIIQGVIVDISKEIEKEQIFDFQQQQLNFELAKTNMYLKSVLNASADAIITTNTEGVIVSNNSSLKDVFQLDDNFYEGKNCLEFLAPSCHNEWKEKFERCVSKGEHQEMMYNYTKEGFKERFIQVSFSPIRTSTGDMEGVLIVAKDNSELYVTRSLLKQSERAFTTIADNMNEAVLLVNNEDRIFYVNNKLKEITGYTDEDLLGEVAKEVLLFDDDKKRMENEIQKRKKGEGSSYEIKLRKKNGDALWANISGAPIYDHKNRIIGSMGIHKDISEIKKYHQELQDIARFPEENPSPVLRFSSNGKLLYCNDASKNIIDYFKFKSGTNPEEKLFIKRVYKENKVVYKEVEFNKKTYHFVYSPVQNAKYVNLYGQDISDLKSINKKLENAKNQAIKEAKAKELFLANMSHEIRTPMNGIMGVIQMIRSTPLNKQQLTYIETLDFSAKNLLTIINDILDLSKIEAGKFNIEKVKFDLRKTIKSTVDSYETISRLKDVELKLFGLDELPTYVTGDPVRLSQVISNLVSNAIKFTDSGTVEVFCSSEVDQNEKVRLNVEIKDTGIGISKQGLKKIFKNFEQAHIGSGRISGGTGLGLSIVKKLLNLQGGGIYVESQVGEGTCFEFYLDYKLASTERPKGNLSKTKLKRLDKVKILLVEDNKINQMVATSFLDEYGAEITLAENGKEALDHIKNTKFDMVLLDLQMPIMDGYETLKRLKRRKLNDLPVVAMTAHALKSEEDKCRALGVADYLTKPLKKEILIKKINLIINGND